jgi:hypothetical protein
MHELAWFVNACFLALSNISQINDIFRQVSNGGRLILALDDKIILIFHSLTPILDRWFIGRLFLSNFKSNTATTVMPLQIFWQI